MKIEVGNKYINVRGGISSVVVEDSIPPYMFRGNDGQRYVENVMLHTLMKTDSDLICEVVPVLYHNLLHDKITHEEVIEKHIEHWSKTNAQ